jgi:abequosyltransferase
MPEEDNSRNKNMKLSIAIPTYNGAKYIREALESIVSQLDDIHEEIEIVVSDNASTDRTPEIIGEYQNEYSFIRYFRNDANFGADKNFDLAVRHSIGKYVWLFSDDDKMLPGAIKKVLDVIKNHSGLAAIFVNWSNYSTDLKRCNIGRTINIQKDIFFKTADDFLSVVKLNAIFVSSNIVCRSLWKQTNLESYIGSNWIHYVTFYFNCRASFLLYC